MSQEVAPETGLAGQKMLPSMATTSLRAVMDTFQSEKTGGGINGYDYIITKLNARGSSNDEQSPDVEDDQLGVKGWFSKAGPEFQMRYEVRFDDDGAPENPLNQDRISRVLEYMDRIGVNDAAVSKARVLFWDERLGELAGNGRSQWHMELVSDYVDGSLDRTEVGKYSINTALIEQEGFQYRVLNCRRLIDRQQELNKSRTKQQPQIEWTGETYGGLRNDLNHNVRRINNQHMAEYGFLKRYGPGEEDSITLLGVESAADEEEIA